MSDRSVGIEALALVITALRMDLITLPGLTPAQVRAVGQRIDVASGDLRDLAYLSSAADVAPD